MNDKFVLSVSQLNRYLKSIINQDSNLQSVYVKGEISNFKNHYGTGHFYMTIKDEFSQIKAVMFKSANARLKFMPEDSMSVIAKGRIDVFERDGQYQLYIDDMQPDGAGALAIAFEQLKRKLQNEGLFDADKKKPIPKFPERVGVITSGTGAAIRDIINVISRRYPLTNIVICPVAVQGEYASSQIKNAIELFNRKKAADVLIVGRGGGSIEDLWAFNEEIVARAVYASEIPVISAVGHETDFTICDFVADLRAATPSAAAELAVPDCGNLYDFVQGAKIRMNSAVRNKIGNSKSSLEIAENKLKRLSPKNYVDNLCIRFDKSAMAMNMAAKKILDSKKSEFSEKCAKLDAMSPLKILSRGYSVVSKNNKIITDCSEIKPDDLVDIRLKNGTAQCKVVKSKG